MAGLREQKRATTMRSIQEVGIALFETRGFEQTTVELVAQEAGVSPSTVYRYFGTKEGILVYDEFDAPLLARVSELFQSHTPVAATAIALEEVLPQHFSRDSQELSERRARLYFEVPSVRQAIYALMDDYVRQLADAIAGSPVPPARTRVQAAAIAGALVFGFWQAVQAWYDAGMVQPLEEAVREAIGAFPLDGDG